MLGRQCVRWANDGDIYCCVHLASRFTGSSTKAEARPPLPGPMCEGTTVLGTQCKHRSLPGSSFCKMHRVRTDAQTISNSTENTLKRRYDEIITSSETANCKDMVLMGEVGSPLHMDRVSVGEACQDRVHLAKKLKLSSQGYCGPEILHSIGSNPHDNGVSCRDSPKCYSLYCDKHIPSWLKRARNGKSGIISKENFLDLLKECCSLEQKLHLHQARELFYKLFKSGVKKYVCRFCGLNFYLLPDLGGHHQAAHVDPTISLEREVSVIMLSGCKKYWEQQHIGWGTLQGHLVDWQDPTIARQLPRYFILRFKQINLGHITKRVNLNVSLEGRYGVMPEFLYLKATKPCIEHNIQLGWPQKGFIFSKSPSLIMSLIPPTNGLVGKGEAHSYDQLNEWKVDECHYIIDLHYFREGAKQNATVLRTDKSHSPEIESLQLGCSFSHSICDPGICNRAHLFYNGYEVAKDIYGKPMGGTFAYDDRGRSVSKEGYLVYECNRMCGFSKTCLNRVLQIGIRGWAVRAGEPIVHGTLGFECAWEVLDEREEEKRLERYGLEGVSYMYNVDAHGNDMSRWIRTGWIGIDATKYGNVSGVHQARTTILPVHIL
ncbi:hypothetical protein Tsubulata_004815 [Turnera subulata]|uniref:C2H2-type domain-containing protein n=1 Tax=Turnera subulata TaxID=218843 RepID=A0A9Q0FC17_9ROSI|nr:hypothetical protein Tsubulata_004815 [Turnera subulata]